MISTCPDPEILVRLGTPALGDSTHDLYIEHVDGCPNCQAVLQRFVDGGMVDPSADLSSIVIGREGFPRVPGFAIERKLGTGATGVVYLARQEESERPVALKLIPGGHAAGPRERRLWLREVKAASKVRHPHVVTLYDFGEAEPWFYLVLEFIPGGSLKDRLRGPLPPRDAARLVELVALAVEKIHTDGLFHLDLKPSNILIEGDEDAPWEKVVPKVTDFSIAGDARTSLGAGMPFGTPAYMAPEQAGSSYPVQLGPASDVYAMGAVLYELLTGQPPIQRNSTVETLDAIRNQEPVPPRRLNPVIPHDLETICLKCLQKEPARRYQSAEALAEDLQLWLGGRSISARPVSPLEKTWRVCRRRPGIATLACVLMFTFFVGFLGMFLLWRHAESERSRAESERSHAEAERARAEAQRSRAETNYRLTSEVLGEMIDLSAAAVETKVPIWDRLTTILQQTKRHLLELALPEPDDPLISQHLAVVDGRLGCTFDQLGRLDEARAAFEESVDRWEKLVKQNPGDRSTLAHRNHHLCCLAELCARQGGAKESVVLFERAIAMSEQLLRIRPDADSIEMLARQRSALANLLARQGMTEQARPLLDANHIMLASVSADAEHPKIALWRIVVQWDIDRLAAATPHTMGSASRDVESGHLDRRVRLSPEVDRVTVPSWAELTVEALKARSRSPGEPSREAETGYLLVEQMTRFAADQRRLGKLDEARRSAE